MKRLVLLSIVASGLFLNGCQQQQSSQGETSDAPIQANVENIKAHMRFLADDLMGGRDTGSDGHEIASLYIATEFAKSGLKPAGDDGTYIQRIPFRQAFLEQTSPQFVLSSEAGDEALDYPNDYITSASVISEQSAVSGELVFVGYGIVAEELNHDDYKGIDVKDKIVVALSGKPKSFPSEEGAHFGSSSQKQKHAVANGAIGYITISTPTAERVRPYQNLLNYLHTPRVRWLDKEGNPANVYPELKNSAYLSAHAAKKLFEGAQTSLDDIYAQLEKDESPAGFALNKRASFSKQSTHKEISSPNVVGILEGSDPVLKDQYVVYSAHSDHIGYAKTVKKDNINNGAMDNASGTSVMLETARMFASAENKPKRSILFVAVTGEEKGLLGSDYYARNPTVPEGAMVANVNLDMPVLLYDFADVIAFGASHSDLKESVTKAAGNIGLELTPDPWPEQALFTRSDHYSFVKQGIPSVFLMTGIKSTDPEVDGAKQFGNFLSTHYHKPSDDVHLPIEWVAAEKFANVNYQIGLTLANQDNKPSWNDGDFFGRTFGLVNK